jgi:hypothetical protein
MNTSSTLFNQLNWLYSTIYFFKKNFLVLAGLGLIAAFGRVIQLGGFGEISSFLNITLEVVIESARVILFLYVLGLANVKKGALRIKHLFTQQENRKQNWRIASQKVKKQWFSILLNLIAFLLIAWTLNYLIDLLAYETCLYLTLKKGGILSNSASEWTILLFFKNLSVIPITLVFDAVFLLWITNKYQINKTLQA